MNEGIHLKTSTNNKNKKKKKKNIVIIIRRRPVPYNISNHNYWITAIIINAAMIMMIYRWLTSIDEGCTHQGSWDWVGDVAGTAVSKTRVAVQS